MLHRSADPGRRPPPGPTGPIALVGPAPEQPCGIADYVARLRPALQARCDLVHATYAEAESGKADACRALLVHYERSLVPDPGYLRRLSARLPGKVFVVPHEVYREDPFAFPYAALRASFPPALWAKRLRYLWSHRGYRREKILQREGYHAHRVIPLSGPGEAILKAMVRPSLAAQVLAPIPLAKVAPAAEADPPAPPGAREGFVLGIYGFLNPGVDYGSALDLVSKLGRGSGTAPSGAVKVTLKILGGDRGEGRMADRLAAEIAERGLGGVVEVTGYLPEAELYPRLMGCDAFLSPFRAKSNSASLLQLISLGKPVFVPAHELALYLLGEGAPLGLYRDAGELEAMALAAMKGAYRQPVDAYPWDLAAVAEAYIRALTSEPN